MPNQPATAMTVHPSPEHVFGDGPPPVLDPRKAKLLPWLVATAFFMQMLDGTILNTALPAIARSLSENPLSMHYVVVSYMLTVALLIPASGWIADRFGTRRVFFAAILIFTLGSFLCAISSTLQTLIISRITQGIGGALMVPVGRLTVLRAYPREQLLQVLSFVTMPGLIGPLFGPALGGLLVEYASWHWIFIINIPVGILGCFLTLRWMPDIYGVAKSKFDFKGFLFFSGSMIMLSVAIEGLGELPLRHGEIIVLLVFGMILMFSYWLLAMRTTDPLFPPKMFSTPTFAVGIGGNLFSRFASGALPFLSPLLLQIGFGFSPLKAGLSMTPLAVAAIFGKYMVRKLVPALGYRRLLVGNTMLFGGAITGLSLIGPDTDYFLLLGMLTVIGACNSLHFTAMNTMTLMDLPDRYASGGNAMLSVVMQLSMSMGVAMGAALLEGFGARYGIVPGSPEILQAFNSTFTCVGAIAIMSASIFFLVPRQAGYDKNDRRRIVDDAAVHDADA